MRQALATLGFLTTALVGSTALAEPTTGPDHATVVGHLGVGWFGISTIPNGVDTGRNLTSISAPAVGVRYWLNPDMGVDVGVGLAIGSSSSSTEVNATTTTTDGPSTFGFMLHGGVPLALHSGAHYTFLITPELNFGYGHQSLGNDSGSGVRLELGARAGAEIQFGFIGVPELALEASVGLFLTYLSGSISTGNNNSVSAHSTQISTSSFNNPWDFFAGNVSARYYF